ncbi:hypothetical protein [Nostoc commune]|uniref:hypothetical protein n=1 Tax=Nostoc commune TaxID=1178 RepID=UPI002B202264|nr:hypothetical protein [Nostoc commune]
MTTEPNQLNLFPSVTPTPARRAEGLVMSADALLKWKSQILDYQQRVRETKPVQQATLFDLARCIVTQTGLIRCSYRCDRSLFGECQQTAPAMRVFTLLLILRLV